MPLHDNPAGAALDKIICNTQEKVSPYTLHPSNNYPVIRFQIFRKWSFSAGIWSWFSRNGLEPLWRRCRLVD